MAAARFSDRQRERDVPLTGADAFLRAFDAECRRHAGAGHLSQLVLRLGRGLDLGALRSTLEAAARAHPILRAPVGRRPGSPFLPVYRTTRPAPETPSLDVHAAGGARRAGECWGAATAAPAPPLPASFFQRLNGVLPIARGALLRADAVPRADGGTDLAFTFAHLLLDGHGSERFIAWLAACGDGKRHVDDLSAAEGAAIEDPEGSWTADLRRRGERARRWQAHLRSLATPPPRSLGGPLSGVRQETLHDTLILSPESSARFLARVKAKAGLLTPALFPLAASLRAHAAVFDARGARPGSFVVPVVANARPRGTGDASRAIFRTHVGMLWLRALAGEIDDLDGLVTALKERRLSFLREGLLEDGLAALELARVAPKDLYARHVRRGFGGELASFFFAFTGEFLPDVTHFFGAPLESGFHVPGLPPSPGSALVFSLRDARLSVTHVWQEGSVTAAERARLRGRLLEDLVGEAGALP